MQRACTVFLALAALGTIIFSFGITSVQSTASSAQEKTLAFIENVLPVDITRYNVTLKNHGVTKLPDLGSTQPIYGKQEILTYTLESENSTLDVICTLQDGVLYIGSMYIVNGSVISDRPYSNVTDAAASFLQKYQAYSKLDSTEMIAMLTDVDPTENRIITAGNLKLTVKHQDLTGTWFGDSISFRWVRVINGCEYLVVNLSFRDGVFAGFIDHRERYSIGNTTVNISKEQAIAIAMDAIKTYSYRISDDWVVTGFNVAEYKTVANLVPTVKEGNTLYPYWSVTLYLNQTYPGSVRELLVGIWAGSGEVFFCHYQAYGGNDLTSDSNSDYMVLDSDSGFEDAPTSPSPSSSENNDAPMDLNVAAIIAVATIAIAVATITLLFKKRKE